MTSNPSKDLGSVLTLSRRRNSQKRVYGTSKPDWD
jgi:hypothetical protein